MTQHKNIKLGNEFFDNQLFYFKLIKMVIDNRLSKV